MAVKVDKVFRCPCGGSMTVHILERTPKGLRLDVNCSTQGCSLKEDMIFNSAGFPKYRGKILPMAGTMETPAPETVCDYERLEIPEDNSIHKETPGAIAYAKGDVAIILNRGEKVKSHPGQTTETSYHLSVACPDRWPTWDEVREARYRFLPRDRDAYMILPAEHKRIAREVNGFHIYMPAIVEIELAAKKEDG